MKELSIEEKAKRYDKALETAKKIHLGEGVPAPPNMSVLEVVFPELKENEDEKIRKELIKFLTVCDEADEREMQPYQKWIAWLEKQGEQKPVVPKFRVGDTIIAKPNLGLESTLFVIDKIEDDSYWDGDKSILICNQDDFEILQTPLFRIGDVIRNKKMGDEVRINGVHLKEQSYDYQGWDGAATIHSDFGFSKQYEWELIEQKPVEWSEEELAQAKKDSFNEALDKIEYSHGEPISDDGGSAAVSFFRKRNIVPQKQWKPTEMQLKCLKDACDKHFDLDGLDPLYALYEQLKAL